MPDHLNDIEKVLRYFHLEIEEHLKSLSAFQRAQLLGNADSTVVDAIFSVAKSCDTADRQKALCEHLRPLLLRLKNSWANFVEDRLPYFCDVDSAANQSTAIVENSSWILPRVISYDALGNPITFQDEVEVAHVIKEEEFAWEEWFGLEQVKNAYCKEMAKTAVVTATLGLHLKDRVAEPLKLTRSKGKVQVIANVDLPVGKLCLPLVVTNPNSLADKSDHPHAVAVTHSVTESNGDCNKIKFYATPEFSLPRACPEGQPHAWSSKHSVLFFWGLARDDAEDKWNCEVTSFIANIVQVMRLNQAQELDGAEPKSVTAELEIPVITNTREIKRGDELVVKCAKPAPKVQAKKVKTWRSDANVNQATKKQKTTV